MSLYMSTAPHVRSPQNTRSLMGDVLIALAPTTIAGIYFFGVSAAIVVALATASAILFEYLWQKLTHKTIRIGDLSAHGAVVAAHNRQRPCDNTRKAAFRRHRR